MTLLNRRRFLAGTAASGASLLAAGTATQDSADTASARAPQSAGFTTITYNVRACEGWGARKGYEARLAAARKQFPLRLALEFALYKPDVITLMEAPREATVAELAGHLHMQYFHYAEGAPGAILTRCPVVESKDRPGGSGPCPEALRGRYFARTVLDTALGRIILYSAHLTSRNKERRMKEVHAIIEVMRGDLASGQSVILQGDLNHTSRWPEYQEWRQAGLVDAFALKGSGVQATQGPTKPVLRLDYIWLHGPIAERLIECRVLFEGAFRTHPEDPATFTFSDHLPVMAAFA